MRSWPGSLRWAELLKGKGGSSGWLVGLVVAGLVLRLLRFYLIDQNLEISAAAQVSLARSLAEPGRMDLVLDGLHPGWMKAPLYPSLIWMTQKVVGDWVFAAVLVSALAAAMLPVATFQLARALSVDAARPIAWATFFLPPLWVHRREYVVAALLVLTAAGALAAWRRQPSMGKGLAVCVSLGALLACRWEAALYGLPLMAGWLLLARSRGAPLLLLTLLLPAALHAWAYPTSSFSERLAERVHATELIVREVPGLAAAPEQLDQLRRVEAGERVLSTRGTDGSAVFEGLARQVPVAFIQGLGLLIGQGLFLWWIAAWTGLSSMSPSLRRVAVVGVFLPMAALTFMPMKPGYLILPWSALAIAAGVGLAATEARVFRRALYVSMAAVSAWAWVQLELDDQELVTLDGATAAATWALEILPPGAQVMAAEPECVLMMHATHCRVLATCPGCQDGLVTDELDWILVDLGDPAQPETLRALEGGKARRIAGPFAAHELWRWTAASALPEEGQGLPREGRDLVPAPQPGHPPE